LIEEEKEEVNQSGQSAASKLREIAINKRKE